MFESLCKYAARWIQTGRPALARESWRQPDD
jgi:hypothetical protein